MTTPPSMLLRCEGIVFGQPGHRLTSSSEFNFSPLQVMATNLMTLEGKQTTVAVVGLAHVDGIEKILAANGWKPQRC